MNERPSVAFLDGRSDEAASNILTHGVHQYAVEAVAHWALLPRTRHFARAFGSVGYVRAGRSCIAVGSPFAPPELRQELRDAFVAASGHPVVFFGRELDEGEPVPRDAYVVGEQPWWNTSGWNETVRGHRTLRSQVRRARNHKVAFRELAPEELRPGSCTRYRLDHLVDAWLAERRMAPMAFVASVAPFALADHRRYFVAERGAAVGLLVATKIAARNAWVIDHIIRAAHAPNGTAEGLFDQAMRALGADEPCDVTMGLAPLFGRVPSPLATVRELTRLLYDFRGLYQFKAKCRPARWQRVLVEHPGQPAWLGTIRALRAFAGGSFLVFGIRTLTYFVPAAVRRIWRRWSSVVAGASVRKGAQRKVVT